MSHKLIAIFLSLLAISGFLGMTTVLATTDDLQVNLEVTGTRALTVSKAGTGTGAVLSDLAGITCGATCAAIYAAGTSVTLTAAADSGSTFAGWSGGGCSGTGSCSVTLDTDLSVIATFNSEVVVPPVTPPGGGGGGILPGDKVPAIIYDLIISELDQQSAVLNWKTDKPTFCQFFWGSSTDYEKGSLSEISFYLSHQTELKNLSPDTIYHFKISCQTLAAVKTQTADQQFITLSLADTLAPANVSELEAIPGDRQITLRWLNPSSPDFKAVLIRRSLTFYPRNLSEGEQVYEGQGEAVAKSAKKQFIDTNLINDQRYYYTVFAYDYSGNYASGAAISAVPRVQARPEIIPPPLVVVPFAQLPTTTQELLRQLTYLDLQYWQSGERISPQAGRVRVDAQKFLTVVLAANKVPPQTKTITVVFKQANKFYTFLLQLNKEQTEFSATVKLPVEARLYAVDLNLLNEKNQVIWQPSGELLTFKVQAAALSCPNLYWLIYLLLLIILLLIIIILLLVGKKRRQD